MKTSDKDILHVIDKNGRHLTIPFSEEVGCREYIVDDEWYLNHGYVTIEQHRENLGIALEQSQNDTDGMVDEYPDWWLIFA